MDKYLERKVLLNLDRQKMSPNVRGLTSVAEFGTAFFRQAQNKLSKKKRSICRKPAIEPSRCCRK
jgi:hypothetical protein